MDGFGSTIRGASRQIDSLGNGSGPVHAPENDTCARSRWLQRLAITMLMVVLLMSAGAMKGESPDSDSTSAEGIASMRMVNPEPPKNSMGKLTKVLLATDAATRMFDAYSTVRMLRNRCGSDATVPVCNEEMFLPDAVTRSSATIYGYESGVWISQVLAAHQLSRHHRQLARLIPILDIATTLPFAINNLRLPINSQAAPMRAQWRIGFSRTY
jgi:hypothetical protein